jgi:hypothetical protein
MRRPYAPKELVAQGSFGPGDLTPTMAPTINLIYDVSITKDRFTFRRHYEFQGNHKRRHLSS